VTWVAVAIGGSALIGAGASYAGAKKQSDAAKNAANLNMDQFHLINQQQQPYIQSGYGALGRLNTLLGLSPNPNATMRPNTGVMDPRMTLPTDSSGAWRPTAGGGVQRMIPGGTPGGAPQMYAGGPGGDPNGGTLQLRQILALRAAHGDSQAQRMLGMV
jgi:hypothetical protein